ncbi:MAG: hypothetical protein K0S23_1254 [Fluviicola sp.]|jgi:hypothetical protein|uniref:hypothetical protein n=1 Tax=Fluviicola sp. TaxID=1917219 RepID=UPI00260231BE|nr:hypothetical protein [Fluviicola sp.]MDF3026947.1 hypothetical protein [Fluviicola sp.]
MIRASAISYAIVFALFIGLLASSVFFIFSAQKRIEFVHTSQEHLLLDSYQGIQLGLQQVKVNDSLQFVHESGDTSIIHKSIWGSYYLVTSQTFKNERSVNRSALIGSEFEGSLPALVIRSGSDGLRICGETFIEGAVYLPNKRVELAYIGGKNYSNPELVYGEINDSKDLKLNLSTHFGNVSPKDFVGNLNPTAYSWKDTSISFLENGAYYQSLDPIQIRSKFRGKIIIQSFDSLVVYKEAQLTNVILIAPKIYIKQGFSGNLQALASESIVLEDSVTLSYPSTLILNEHAASTNYKPHSVYLGANSSVLGGVLLTTQQYDFRKQPKLTIQKNSVIAGVVFNCGISEVYGSIIGSLNTGETLTLAGGGSYTNHLLDAIISTKRLPQDFVCPAWFEFSGYSRKKIISCELES